MSSRPTCSECGTSKDRIDTYWNGDIPRLVCDPCILAGIDKPASVHVGNRYYVAPNGAEFPMPSYGE